MQNKQYIIQHRTYKVVFNKLLWPQAHNIAYKSEADQ